MTCTGAGGSTSGSATVSVSATSVPPSTKFTSGDRVQTTSALNVRSSGSASGTLLGAQANGSLGTIVSGGQFTDGYYWWQVDYDVAPDGWSVEDFLVDYVPTVPPPPDPEAPTLSLSASPVEISAGQSSTLLWSSTNSSSCSASWTASTATSGSQAVSPSVTTTYSMFCTGAGGSVTDIATVTVVTVTEPPSTPGFSIGDWVETTTKLNIRESSSTNSKRLGAQPSGSRGVLTQGPIPNGGYTWWYVDYAQEPDGWSAGEYLRESSAPGPLGPGARVVTLSNLKVRSEPTTSSSQLGVQKSGSQGTILLGPVSANGYTWWNVDFDSGADGWVAGEYLGR
jgi:hypothetical protein